MKKIHLVLGAVILLMLPWGLNSRAEAGCGGNSGCGMSHKNSQQTAAAQTNAANYTCPMHPEVVSDRPGKCPKCGMTLERVAGKVGEQSDTSADMAAQCQQLADEFGALQDHFDLMMKLTDVDDLAPAMIKHGEMMAQFSEHLEKHLKMCRKMTSGTSDEEPNDTVNSDHGH